LLSASICSLIEAARLRLSGVRVVKFMVGSKQFSHSKINCKSQFVVFV
jgi:hypothetical protein